MDLSFHNFLDALASAGVSVPFQMYDGINASETKPDLR